MYVHTYIWKLEINYKKRKCMSFSKGNVQEKQKFYIEDKEIQNVRVQIPKNNYS